MASYTYRIESFTGIDQSKSENRLSPSFSPDAMNMDTSNGDLSVTKGYVKHISQRIPKVGEGIIDRIMMFRSSAGVIPLAVTGGCIYKYSGGSWALAYQYQNGSAARKYSVLMTSIGNTDTMLIADGLDPILKFDGEFFSSFGSSAGCSNIAVGFIAMYRGRLFAAGDASFPNRLYYSKLPGSGRTIEDWGPDPDSPSVEGGHVEIGTTSGDPITAICAMSNQLLIFKKSTVYRLIGDRPGNFNIELIQSDSTPVAETATAVYRDAIYFVTDDGLHCFNGVDAAPMPDSRMIRLIMEGADVTDSRMAVVGDKLYFTIKKDGASRLIEYDLTSRRYMQYGGFGIFDLLSSDGSLLLAVSSRYIERWGEGDSFDGTAIQAYWNTPLTDLADKSAIKSLNELYLRGTPRGTGMLLVDTWAGRLRDTYSLLLPETTEEVLEVPLKNEGRTLRIRLYNEAGSRFTVTGGLELNMCVRRRTD